MPLSMWDKLQELHEMLEFFNGHPDNLRDIDEDDMAKMLGLVKGIIDDPYFD